MPVPGKSLIVHKFGGAALADGAAMAHAASILEREGGAPVVVASAMAGVTDALFTLARRAAEAGLEGLGAEVRRVAERHLAVACTFRDAGVRARVVERIERTFADLTELLTDLGARGELTRAAADRVVARGERLSALLFWGTLTEAGVAAEVVDAAALIQTDGRFGNAAPDLPATQRAVQERLVPVLEEGRVPVVPGFLGAGPGGAVVTLGRGGSDLTATVLGRALGAKQVVLWKDVPGVLTADPRTVPDARVVSHLHTREAGELAYQGAKVLHPRALTPLTKGMRVVIRPFADPTAQGTEISMRAARSGKGRRSRSPVRAISATTAQALVTVSGNGILGLPGIAARTFRALETADLSVTLISQSSSAHSLCLAVRESDAIAAAESIRAAFAEELARSEIQGVEVRTGVATLAVVGVEMVHTPGVAAKVFATLADSGINIIAIAQDASELNISVVVDEASAGEAQRAIHSAFQLGRMGGGRAARSPTVDVVLHGFGRIGREVAAQLPTLPTPPGNSQAKLRIVGVLDRGGYVFDARGLSQRRLAALSRHKMAGHSVAEARGGQTADPVQALRAICDHALSRPVLVDVAAGDTRPVLGVALESGMDLVLANKAPLAADAASADTLLRDAALHGRRVLHEATVGAGLPIIDTVSKLIGSGDRIVTIEGCPSGTLGFLFGELGRGERFSDALRNAVELGYTEPDPRDDLSGLDVARKGLILGRLIGYRGEITDVSVESLVPESLRDVTLSEFFDRLDEADEAWEARVGEAAERGEVLRYRVRVTRRSIRVGVVSVPVANSLATLSGTDNQFTFTTARYRANPLIITGPGAGPAVTAAGVMGDLLKLAGA
jgi:aspartokinase/homoserine dehydrogenase 1